MMKKTYIKFVEYGNLPKTKIWRVFSDVDTYLLGEVRWFGRWRCYSFFPETCTIFEKICLRDIADFCEEKTNEHRRGWKKKQDLITWVKESVIIS